MRLNWKSFVSLRADVIVTFIVLWNIGLFYAMYAGGGGLQGALTPIGMKITGYVCVAASAFSFSVAALRPVQDMLIEPSRAHNFTAKEFYFLTAVLGILAVSRFILPAEFL